MNETGNIRSWARNLDAGTIEQAERTAALPILAGPLALMPDAHLGYGVTIGSVIATREAIIPSAVGVDVGCGMHAEKLCMTGDDLMPHLGGILDLIAETVPAGVGRNNESFSLFTAKWLAANEPPARFTDAQRQKAATQLGTLGSGNHFIELSTDQDGTAWIVLHSGSRGVGNDIAQAHIAGAKKDFVTTIEGYELEDPNLAWLTQDTPAFAAYWADLQWLQRYAAANRAAMLATVLRAIGTACGWEHIPTSDSISCHHNYAELEHHHGENVYVTRKGAIDASVGRRGIIPGSMGTSTFLVTGKGNEDSWRSCSHGAGRAMSRTQAKRNLTTESLAERMEGKAWLDNRAGALLDEHPAAYKDIDEVMSLQTDLVEVTHRLEAILNYKG